MMPRVVTMESDHDYVVLSVYVWLHMSYYRFRKPGVSGTS